MNWFAASSVPLYLSASAHSFLHGNKAMAGMWACYAVANAFLVLAETSG